MFENVTDRIIQLLKEQNMRQIDLANACGISANAITNYIKKQRIPDTKSLYLMAQTLNTTMEWLLTGEGIKSTNGTADKDKAFLTPARSDLEDYLKSVCQVDYATAGERLKQARELAGITLEEAAARAYLKADALKRLEEESYFNTDTTDLQQLACLAYLYDVDLYWVFSGKARPPAAVLVEGIKNYPPYEFMLEQAPVPTAAGSTTTDATHTKLNKDEQELLDSYSYLNLVGKKETHKFIHYQLYQEQNLSSSSDLNHDENRGKLA